MNSYNNPLVTIGIPSINHEIFITKMLYSIYNQTYKNIELIIVDDCSDDNTYLCCENFLKQYSDRFVSVTLLKNNKNCGTALTLNKILKLVKGCFFVYLSSDDVISKELISTEVKYLLNDPTAVLVVPDSLFIDNKGNHLYCDVNRNFFKGSLPEGEYFRTFSTFYNFHRNNIFKSSTFGSLETLLQGNYIPNGYMIRSEKLAIIEFTKKSPLEDYYLMLNLSLSGHFIFINKPLFLYRIHDNNISKNIKRMKKITQITLYYFLRKNFFVLCSMFYLQDDHSLLRKILMYLIDLKLNVVICALIPNFVFRKFRRKIIKNIK